MKAKKTQTTKPVQRRRRKGSGTILNRRGIFVVRWHDADGNVHQESTGLTACVRNKKAADELLAKKTALSALLTQDEQLAVLIRERETIQAKIARLQKLSTPALTLSGIADAFSTSPRRKDYKPAALESHLRHLAAFVDWAERPDMEVSEVTDAVAVRYSQDIGAKFSGSTYNKHMDSLTAVWKALGSASGIAANPWEGIARKRLEAHSRRALTDAEIESLLATATGEYRDLICIGLRTGLRLGDCARLRWEAFKDDGTLEVMTAKTGAPVKLPSAALLADLGRTGSKGYVCPDAAALYDSPSRSNLCYYIAKVFADAGITGNVKEKGWQRARADASFHSLRHTFVTKCVQCGMPRPFVQALVGHATAAMSEHYTHLSAESILAEFRKAGM